MDAVFDNISSLFVFTIAFLVLYAIILNLYFIHKNGFRISVNCWFCNKNSKVLYAKRNSFECPFCNQYNGFDKKGHYNKVIEAQHNVTLNNSISAYQLNGYLNTQSKSNGLCDSCIRNQQLKVLQLSKYEPLKDKNYDTEIEHFEKQLDKSYKLCKTCLKTVKSTIRRQNAWLFGTRLKNIKSSCKKSLSYVKLNKQSQENIEDSKFYYSFIIIIKLTLLMGAVFNLFVLCGFDGFIPNDLLSQVLLPRNVIFLNFCSTVYNFTKSNLDTYNYLLPKTAKFKESTVLYVSVFELILEFFFTFMEIKNTLVGKLNKILCWIIVGLASSIDFKSPDCIYVNTLQIFCSLWLLYSYGSTCFDSSGKRPKKYTLKRLEKYLDSEENLDDDESSTETLNNTKISYHTANSKRSPITANYQHNSLNRSYESVRSVKSVPLFNNVSVNDASTARNVELNKHFHNLNLGAFKDNRPMSCQSFPSPASPNPFLNPSSRPQSPRSLIDYGTCYNNSFYAPKLNSSLFKLPNTTSAFAENQPSTFLNQTGNLSHKSFRVGDHQSPYPTLTQPLNITNNLNISGSSSGHTKPNLFTTSRMPDDFSPRETSSVFSHAPSPTYPQSVYSQRSMFQAKSPDASLNNSFQPNTTIERPTRALLSPSKLNHIKTFHSDLRHNENLSLSFHMENVPSSSFWSKLNGSNMPQRFVVNSLSDIQHPLNSFNYPNKKISNISRSSSSSSGFVSNGDVAKAASRSLPNSRDHSPDRNSLLSEPPFHLKTD